LLNESQCRALLETENLDNFDHSPKYAKHDVIASLNLYLLLFFA
jgi:hypothetical protein